MKIAYDHVHSSNIRALGFSKGVGYVEFNSGARWGYEMSLKTFNELKGAKSIGSYFAKAIKGKAKVVFRGQCCSNSPCKNDAVSQAAAAGITFYLCEEHAKEPRFDNRTITPYVAPEAK